MNNIYAIDPSPEKDLKDLSVLSNLFGFSTGRFIANYPNDWISFLKKTIEQMKPIEKVRAGVLLTKIQKNSLPFDDPSLYSYKRGSNWISNASELQQRLFVFTQVVEAKELEKFLHRTDLPDGQGDHIIRPIGLSHQKWSDLLLLTYERLIDPLFRVSTEIHVQDMHFNFCNENRHRNRGIWNVTNKLIYLADKYKRCEKLIFHLNKDNNEAQNFFNTFEDIRKEPNAETLEIIYTLEDKKFAHGRYIFSIKGGLQFDHGFNPTNLERNHIHWMSEKELSPLLERYSI